MLYDVGWGLRERGLHPLAVIRRQGIEGSVVGEFTLASSKRGHHS